MARVPFGAALPTAALLVALAVPAIAATVDMDLVPGGTVLSTLSSPSEVETFRVTAAAGSTLTLDLRPAGKGAFRPALESLELNGDALALPSASPTGKTKARIPFAEDGVLEIRVGSGSGGTGDYALRTSLKVRRTLTFTGNVGPDDTVDVPLYAPADALASVLVKPGKGSALVPRIHSVVGPDEATVPPASTKSGAKSDLWKSLAAGAGPWTLRVVGDSGSTGAFSGKVKWKVARGAGGDFREPSVPEALQGPYNSFLVSPPSLTNPTGSVLTGELVFDGAGGITTALRTLVLLPDAGSPLGIGFQVVDLPAGTGTYFTDGAVAALSLDLGTGTPLELSLQVAAAGNVLLPSDPPETGPATVGALLKGAAAPTTASLAGSWFYVNYEAGDTGEGSVEIGTLTLGSSGTVTGLGAGIAITSVEGTPVPGTPVPLVRVGSFSVDGSGGVTFSTAPLFQSPDTWTADPVFLNDILLGRGPDSDPASVMRAFLRQGTGLDESDVDGAYFHVGLTAGTGVQARTGTLFFDGEGGFAGTEAVYDLASGTVQQAVPTPGTYTVDSAGLATFTRDGGPTGNGIVGPEGNYLLTLALDGSGVSIDFLLHLYTPDDL